MTMKPFPRTTVAGVSLPRMLMGTNWVYGYSHTGAAADKNIVRMNSNKEAIQAMLEAYLAYDINAIMGPISDKPFTYDAIHAAEDKTGKGIIQIDTPTLVMDDNAQARKESEAILDKSRKGGATFCLIHHSAAEQLVNKNKRTMDRLPDYLKMIRDRGMIPGLSAHMPELILYSDLNGYDVETYIQIYNCMGFMMQVEIESVNKIIWEAKKPVMTIKSMAAGRCSPFVGITFSFSTLRPCDMVTVGAMTADEVHEDVEIGMAAIERRRPDLEGRNSPGAAHGVDPCAAPHFLSPSAPLCARLLRLRRLLRRRPGRLRGLAAPPALDAVDQEGRKRDRDDGKEDLLHRDVGQRKAQNQEIREEIRARQAPVRDVGDGQRQGVVAPAGPALPHDDPNAHPDKGRPQHRRQERMGRKVRQHRGKLLPNFVKQRDAERGDGGRPDKARAQVPEREQIAGGVQHRRDVRGRKSQPVLDQEHEPDHAALRDAGLLVDIVHAKGADHRADQDEGELPAVHPRAHLPPKFLASIGKHSFSRSSLHLSLLQR